jgi:zinc transport system substrate-binding protein
MKKHILILLIVGIMLVAGCTSNSIVKDVNQDEKIQVITTLFPLYEFSKEVGGEKADVSLLLPPGVESHTFEPRPSDINKIGSADMFVYIGEGMEPWAQDILEGVKNPNRLDIEASKFVELLKTGDHHDESEHNEDENESEHHDENENELDEDEPEHSEESEHEHEEYDPHFWLDFEQDTKVVDAIAQAYIQKDSENKEYYLANAQKYKQKLEELDNSYKTSLASCKQNEFITGGHNAYNYLGNRYGLEFVSAYGISPDSEPTPQTIKEIADLAAEHNIKYILVEELISPRMAQAIANDADAEVLIFNPGHNLLKEEFDEGVTFISLMEINLINLKQALECD